MIKEFITPLVCGCLMGIAVIFDDCGVDHDYLGILAGVAIIVLGGGLLIGFMGFVCYMSLIDVDQPSRKVWEKDWENFKNRNNKK